MAAWAGLGYYARARNLKKCAEAVATQHDGVFPDTEDGLKSLPGIGDYTAAAVAAIAFNRRAAVMDGNVERVISRLYAIATPLPAGKAADEAEGGAADAGRPAGRFRAGDDGSRRDDLHAEAAGLFALSVQGIVRGAAACMIPSSFRCKARQEGKANAARCGLHCGNRRMARSSCGGGSKAGCSAA